MNFVTARWATPLTLGLFAVSAVSGVALFLHTGQAVFHEMHEWLSIVLLAPFALHVARNWTALLAYVKRSALWAPLAVSLVAALAFGVPGALEGAHGSPMLAARLIADAPLADLAPLLKTTPESLRAALAAKGYAADAPTLRSAAAAAHKSPLALLAELAAAP